MSTLMNLMEWQTIKVVFKSDQLMLSRWIGVGQFLASDQ